MGVDRGVRAALAKVSNIAWFRVIRARCIPTPGSILANPANDDEFANDETAPHVARLPGGDDRH